MRRSLRKEYELNRDYDYNDAASPKYKRRLKRASHRRIRKRFSALCRLLTDWISRERGFTLAEVLIVIAILAVLMAIVCPLITGNTQSAMNDIRIDQLGPRAEYILP